MQLLIPILSLLSLALPSDALVAKRQITGCLYTCLIGVCQPRCGFFPATIVDQICTETCTSTCSMECDKVNNAEAYYEESLKNATEAQP